MKNDLNKIFFILTGEYNFKLSIILVLTLIMSLLEVFSIALIIPLLTNLLDGDKVIFFLVYSKYFYNYSSNEILLIVLSIFLIVFLTKNIFLIIFNAAKIKFSYHLFVNTSNKIFKNYLFRDYSFFIKQNSSEFIRNVNGECNVFAFGVIMPIITLISDFIIVFFISLFLLFYNFSASSFVIIFIFLLSAILLKITNNKFKFWGTIRLKYSGIILQNLQESYGYIKEIIFSGSQKYFIDRHFNNNIQMSESSINRDIYQVIPRPLLESIALLAFYVLIITLVSFGIDKSNILILIGVVFFASIKLLPSVSNIIKSLQSLKYNSASVDAIYEEVRIIKKINKKADTKKLSKNFSKIVFNNVKFQYVNKKLILNNLYFEVKNNEKIGIVGRSGGGKTTFLNLFTGLLKASSGSIMIDKKPINNVTNQWKKKIGYVHQNTFLADDTILFNITLSKNNKKKEILKVWNILKIVDLDKFVKSQDLGINTIMGERGSKFSGGQCQRIGIARVLYRNPSIIIFDEATSALDEQTQNKVLKSIYKSMNNKTIITVSHRANSLKYCNKIFKFTDGKLVQK